MSSPEHLQCGTVRKGGLYLKTERSFVNRQMQHWVIFLSLTIRRNKVFSWVIEDNIMGKKKIANLNIFQRMIAKIQRVSLIIYFAVFHSIPIVGIIVIVHFKGVSFFIYFSSHELQFFITLVNFIIYFFILFRT